MPPTSPCLRRHALLPHPSPRPRPAAHGSPQILLPTCHGTVLKTLIHSSFLRSQPHHLLENLLHARAVCHWEPASAHQIVVRLDARIFASRLIKGTPR